MTYSLLSWEGGKTRKKIPELCGYLSKLGLKELPHQISMVKKK